MPKTTDEIKGSIRGAAKAAGQAVRGRIGIYATLSKEHGEVASLMSELADTGNDDVERREDLFATIETELLAHAKAEDAVFYSAIADRDTTREKIEHAREEHQEVETLLEELGQMDITHQSWMNKFLKLEQSVEHHVQEEEHEVFARAQKLLSVEDARALDDDYRARRDAEKKKRRPAA